MADDAAPNPSNTILTPKKVRCEYFYIQNLTYN